MCLFLNINSDTIEIPCSIQVIEVNIKTKKKIKRKKKSKLWKILKKNNKFCLSRTNACLKTNRQHMEQSNTVISTYTCDDCDIHTHIFFVDLCAWVV